MGSFPCFLSPFEVPLWPSQHVARLVLSVSAIATACAFQPTKQTSPVHQSGHFVLASVSALRAAAARGKAGSLLLSRARLLPSSATDLSRGWQGSQPTEPARGSGFRCEPAVSHRHHGYAGERERELRRMPSADAPRSLRLFGGLEKSQGRWGLRGSTSVFRRGSCGALCAPPRARWLRPGLNAPLITHRKRVRTLHTGR